VIEVHLFFLPETLALEPPARTLPFGSFIAQLDLSLGQFLNRI